MSCMFIVYAIHSFFVEFKIKLIGIWGDYILGRDCSRCKNIKPFHFSRCALGYEQEFVCKGSYNKKYFKRKDGYKWYE